MFRFFEQLVDPFRPHPPGAPPATLGGFYWHHLRQVWPLFAALMVVGLFVALIEVSIFRYIGAIVDILDTTTPDRLWAEHGTDFLWMAAVILIGRPFFTMLHDLLTHQAIAPSFTNLIRWQNHRHVLRQSIAFFNNDFAGRVATKVIQTGPSLRESVVQVTDAVWFVVLYTVSALVLFAEADLRLALPLIVWVVLYVVVLRHFVPRTKKASEEISEARSLLTGRVVDSYTNIHTVKLFAHAEREDNFARTALEDHTAVFFAQQRLITQMTTTISVINSVLVTVVGALAIWLWQTGSITTGAIALVGGLVVRIINMSGWIMWEVQGVFENVGIVQDGITTIARPHTVVDAPRAKPLAVTGGEIRFEDVHFHYGRSKGALDGVTLTIRPGEKIGVVGPSGAGKSTLVNVFLRLYDLEGGCILIDGQDVSAVTQESLRAAVGVVTQDTSLLHRSIRENVKYGRPDATDGEMVEATELAHAADFVVDLADARGRTAYDAHVGERGVKLSGGQRQRVAIARVLLKNAPILVLDEATSALDSDVEAAIQESLETLMAGKTVIAIAHRLSTIARMDRLVVMDKGRIVETGTHAELVARGGLYAGLWARQTGGFLDLGDEAGAEGTVGGRPAKEEAAAE
ncbi:ABC transporter ATP-binding protein [Oharaeibacter diazotrophicus]|uniref:ATP-binding cassette subfamily B multidrug efflux pump n=1 Tax=Oharaeibacter diazotrophicus TaxID=1920512 RepID=A0A4R6RCX7_9HYPH|nr:ABC transporter ATP-binding protein [Oharaeibacter diazotrophicus]TDP83546.1 ATP-binding cassette subfamily B multidrug efflux pump [Oharaeibacter diazotrophicus]BBE72379.1 putative multidrug export ATP-binding/permease protein [Pleomorphomonas sp. SM30]GLS79150.1 ABC transporter ATP-binding protein/permease [Oharaeibacter diazotrophicus]